MFVQNLKVFITLAAQTLIDHNIVVNRKRNAKSTDGVQKLTETL